MTTSRIEKLREFIRLVYVERRFHPDAPERNITTNKNKNDNNNNASTSRNSANSGNTIIRGGDAGWQPSFRVRDASTSPSSSTVSASEDRNQGAFSGLFLGSNLLFIFINCFN